MSRIGKQPITVPSGVKVNLDNGTIKVTGPQGSLEMPVRPEVDLNVDEKSIEVTRKDDSSSSRALHGLTRALIANMVRGVSEGFTKKLEIVGVGYKADVKGNVVNLSLGFSHPVNYTLPEGISASVEKQTQLEIKGADKQVVGQVAADIRGFRPPEPYKGKGIKYADETIRRKAGKAGKAGGK
jgi:large subunit ribosomal protein L6